MISLKTVAWPILVAPGQDPHGPALRLPAGHFRAQFLTAPLSVIQQTPSFLPPLRP